MAGLNELQRLAMGARRRKPLTLAQKLNRAEVARKRKCGDCGALKPTLRGNPGEYAACTKCGGF